MVTKRPYLTQLKRKRNSVLVRCVAVAAAAAVGMAACGSSPNSTGSASTAGGGTATTARGGSATVPGTGAASGTPYVVQVNMPETGPEASIGTPLVKGMQVEQAYINAHGGFAGHPLELKFTDNQSSISTAVSQVSQVLSSNPPVVITGVLTAMVNAVFALSRPSGPLMYSISPGVPEPSADSIDFVDGPSGYQQAVGSVAYAVSRGWKRLAIFYSADATGQQAQKYFSQVVKLPQFAGKISLVAQETFSPTAVSASTEADQIAAAHPDAVVAWSVGLPIGVAFQAIQQSPLKSLPIISSPGDQTYTIMQRFSGELPAQLFFAGPRYTAGKTGLSSGAQQETTGLYSAFSAAGLKVDGSVAFYWDTLRLLQQAVTHLGVKAKGAQLAAYLETIKGYEGVNGTYSFSKENHIGSAQDSVRVSQWSASTQTWIAAPT